MGEVAVGDELIDAQGQPTRVVAATEVMTGRPCYQVHFSDGSVIVGQGTTVAVEVSCRLVADNGDVVTLTKGVAQ